VEIFTTMKLPMPIRRNGKAHLQSQWIGRRRKNQSLGWNITHLRQVRRICRFTNHAAGAGRLSGNDGVKEVNPPVGAGAQLAERFPLHRVLAGLQLQRRPGPTENRSCWFCPSAVCEISNSPGGGRATSSVCVKFAAAV